MYCPLDTFGWPLGLSSIVTEPRGPDTSFDAELPMFSSQRKRCGSENTEQTRKCKHPAQRACNAHVLQMQPEKFQGELLI